MARWSYRPAMGENTELTDHYQGNLSIKPGFNAKHFTIVSGSESLMTLEGRGLKYNDDGAITKGTVTRVLFETVTHVPYAIVDKTEFAGAHLMDALVANGLDGVVEFLSRSKDTLKGTGLGDILHGGYGADTLIGKGGADELHGDIGNDRLTGGGGADLFVFSKGLGKDIVTDFDVNGGDHDVIYNPPNEDPTIRKSGHDTVIDFGNGHTITLLDVKKSDFSEDFILSGF